MIRDVVPHHRPAGRPSERPVSAERTAPRNAHGRPRVAGADIVSTPRPTPPTVHTQQRAQHVATAVPDTIPAVHTNPYQNHHSGYSHKQKKKVLHAALKKHGVTRRQKGSLLRRYGLPAAAAAIIAMTGYVSVDTWLVNRQLEKGAIAVSETASVAGVQDAAQEGSDKTPVDDDIFTSHMVAADEPRYFQIPSLDIDARVLPMGINSTGSIQAPINIFDTGWYTDSVKPGEVGAVFIDGHASIEFREGVFGYIDALSIGDRVSVETGDGTQYDYDVVNIETVPLEGLDMRKALLPQDGVLRGLNIMTCVGEYLPDQQTYDQRLIVYTKQVSI